MCRCNRSIDVESALEFHGHTRWELGQTWRRLALRRVSEQATIISSGHTLVRLTGVVSLGVGVGTCCADAPFEAALRDAGA